VVGGHAVISAAARGIGIKSKEKLIIVVAIEINQW